MKVFIIVVVGLILSTDVDGSKSLNISGIDLHYSSLFHTSSSGKAKIATFTTTDTSTNCYMERDWYATGQDVLINQLQKSSLNTNNAKNLVLFLGDGLSTPTYMASRWYMGGTDNELAYDKFPYFGLSKTYCVDRMVPDSACTSTAYTCGVKANLGTLGVDENVEFNNCFTGLNAQYHVESIAKWAQDAGKSTGFITTTTVSHASPSGLYAHTANRMWEDDTKVAELGCDPSLNHDIVRQLVESNVGKKFNVIMGGGRQHFLPKQFTDEEGNPGTRSDGRNLITQWQTFHPNGKYVYNKAQLNAVDASQTDHLLGLFYPSVFPFNYTIESDKPTLSEMVPKALEILKKNPKGFFLFIEGGLIDFGHHFNVPKVAFEENIEYSNAMQKVKDSTDSWDTLIVATSDHSHTMSVSGYPLHDSDMFGVAADESALLGSGMANDNLPYSILSYANGPSYESQRDGINRADLRLKNTADKLYQPPSIAPAFVETHGGDDVGIFASGPWSHLFTGVLEQHYIPHAMAYAASIGNGKKAYNYL